MCIRDRFTGGNCNIGVWNVLSCCSLIVAFDLKFLRCAGHYTDHHNILRVESILFGKQGLNHCTGHLLWGLTGRYVWQQIREIVLAELNPPWRARGNHRQYAAILYAIQEFGRLFHDGEVSAEVGIKYLVKAEAAQGGNHLAFYIRTNRHSKAFAQSRTNGGSGLYHNILFRVIDRRKNFIALIALGKSTCRATHNALAAGNAGHFVQGTFKHAADVRIKAAAVRADDSHMLVGTSGNTPAAEDTFSIVADQILGGLIFERFGFCAVEVLLSLIHI